MGVVTSVSLSVKFSNAELEACLYSAVRLEIVLFVSPLSCASKGLGFAFRRG